MDKVINHLESRELLSSCGKELPLQEKGLEDLKAFVLKYIYCQMHFELSEHPSPLGNGWELINGKCRPVRYTLSALPEYLIHEKKAMR